MIKAAIFDMDGTLTDTQAIYDETWHELEASYGVDPDPNFTKAVCGSNGDNMKRIIHNHYPTIDEVAFMNDCYRIVYEKVKVHVPLKEGAQEICAYLKEKGFKLAIASSNTVKKITEHLTKCGLISYFDEIVGMDDITAAKPDPEIYQVAAKRLWIAPEECYVFEDGFNGIRSGLGAGCKVAMVVDTIEPDDVIAPQCAAIFYSLLEAKQAIEEGKF